MNLEPLSIEPVEDSDCSDCGRVSTHSPVLSIRRLAQKSTSVRDALNPFVGGCRSCTDVVIRSPHDSRSDRLWGDRARPRRIR